MMSPPTKEEKPSCAALWRPASPGIMNVPRRMRRHSTAISPLPSRMENRRPGQRPAGPASHAFVHPQTIGVVHDLLVSPLRPVDRIERKDAGQMRVVPVALRQGLPFPEQQLFVAYRIRPAVL